MLQLITARVADVDNSESLIIAERIEKTAFKTRYWGRSVAEGQSVRRPEQRLHVGANPSRQGAYVCQLWESNSRRAHKEPSQACYNVEPGRSANAADSADNYAETQRRLVSVNRQRLLRTVATASPVIRLQVLVLRTKRGSGGEAGKVALCSGVDR